jgi:hypothetical protein
MLNNFIFLAITEIRSIQPHPTKIITKKTLSLLNKQQTPFKRWIATATPTTTTS